MTLQDLSREDLEFVAGWLLAGNVLCKKNTPSAKDLKTDWPNEYDVWLAIDDAFGVAEYNSSAIGAILALKGQYREYDKAIRGLDEVEAGHGW